MDLFLLSSPTQCTMPLADPYVSQERLESSTPVSTSGLHSLVVIVLGILRGRCSI